MTLDGFFRTIAPLLDGSGAPEEVARALYGPGGGGRDGERLAIYARFCRAHRSEVLDQTYEACRRAVVRARGDAAWDALVQAYARRHPMRHFELNQNGAALPAFLDGGYAREAGLPGWLGELGDFEWWEWATRVAPDDPRDAEAGGPLRLASTVELRPYQFDFVSWLDGGEEADAPPHEGIIVLFWRDRELDARRDTASPEELAVLKSVYEGLPLPGGLAETVMDLHEAGILLGD